MALTLFCFIKIRHFELSITHKTMLNYSSIFYTLDAEINIGDYSANSI